MSLYTSVIVNPASAGGNTGKQWPQIRKALDRVLERWDNQFTLAPGDATEMARKAVEEGYEQIVVVGGDGTMNEAVCGLFAADESAGISKKLIRDDIVITPVRAGTGGDFARYLGLSHKVPEAVAHVTGQNTRTANLGLVEFDNPEGVKTRRAFLNIASFGLSGLTDAKVNESSKSLGSLSFVIAIGQALWEYRAKDVKITVDGQEFYQGPVILGAVANGQYFGSGVHFAPQAEIDDGVFQISVLTQVGMREVMRAADIYSGKMIDWPAVRHTAGKEVVAEIVSPDQGECLLDIDGEQPGALSATFKMVAPGVRIGIP